jgi:hypothetical protein
MMAEQPNPAMSGLDLETVLRELHDSDIRVGIQTSDEGIQIWISDRLHRIRTARMFKQSGAKPTWLHDSAALWLHEAALGLFPGSPYARDHRPGTHEGSGGKATAGLGKRSGSAGRAATNQTAEPSG